MNLFAETGDILLCETKKDVYNEIYLIIKLVDNIEKKEKIFVLSVAENIK